MGRLRAIGSAACVSLATGALAAAAASAALVATPAAPSRAARAAATLPAPATKTAGADLQQRLNRMLAGALGPQRALVSADVTLNGDRTQTTALRYRKLGTPVQSQSARTQLTGPGSASYSRAARATAWAHSTTATTTTFAPGAIRQIHLAMLVSTRVAPRTVKQLKRTIAAAAGLNRARGDTFAVTRTAFAPVAAPTASRLAALLAKPGARPALAAGRWVLLIAGVLIFLLLAARNLRPRPQPT
jgi:flagellar biosynthesis/type III secretory pathway M-ring protein FliF/YscJ